MERVNKSLILAVFAACCWLAWFMLTLLLEVRDAGRVLPMFTNLCIALRPALLVLPLVVAGFSIRLWFWRPREVRASMALLMVTMTLLLLYVIPAMATSYLLIVGPVKSATGVH